MNLFSLNLLVGSPSDTYWSVAVPKLLHELVSHRRSPVLRKAIHDNPPSLPRNRRPPCSFAAQAYSVQVSNQIRTAC